MIIEQVVKIKVNEYLNTDFFFELLEFLQIQTKALSLLLMGTESENFSTADLSFLVLMEEVLAPKILCSTTRIKMSAFRF